MASPHGDSNHYAKLLLETDFLREEMMRDVIRWVGLPSGSHGLDAGCGVGSHSLLLADAVGPGGHVTGLDISPEFLRMATERARDAGYGARTDFRVGDINNLELESASLDWAWSADCVGPGTGDPFAQVKGLARIVRPGGLVTVLSWSTQNLLPGHPRLEARLNSTSAGIAPFKQGMKSEAHLFRAKEWFAGAGLEETIARSFISDVQAPLDDATRNALLLLFDMRWGSQSEETDEEDWALYNRLITPSSPDFILNEPGYYAFFTYTVFRGRKPDAVPHNEENR
jgi:ubiquinone/menaquinone biosynthesis C-methylase UbiE